MRLNTELPTRNRSLSTCICICRFLSEAQRCSAISIRAPCVPLYVPKSHPVAVGPCTTKWPYILRDSTKYWKQLDRQHSTRRTWDDCGTRCANGYTSEPITTVLAVVEFLVAAIPIVGLVFPSPHQHLTLRPWVGSKRPQPPRLANVLNTARQATHLV